EMPIRCVVVDFDGTFTDVEAEAAEFESSFQAEVATVCERDVSQAWREERAEIAAHPQQYGWVYNGVVVAPANADPYIRTSSVAQRVFDRFGVLTDKDARSATVQAFYRKAYERTKTAFRPDARDVLEALVDSGLPVAIVTNAHPDVVLRKLETLAPRGREKLNVRGEARKFVLEPAKVADPRFSALPETRQLSGLPRPIYLRRGPYFDTLRAIWAQTGTTPDETLLAGDIFELDLAMPAALGVRVHLVEGPGVAPWEREAVIAMGERGGLSDTLRPILGRIDAVR
ncbi:MAG TPA: HAD family hydrolase, partial [Myxococcaceae bacterium]|nr:HAD family hydrolase [Myxococcaceae bacterium]